MNLKSKLKNSKWRTNGGQKLETQQIFIKFGM